jgi:hypothetical protein
LAPMTRREEKAPLEQSLQSCEYPTGNGWADNISTRHDEALRSAPATCTSPPKRVSVSGPACTHRTAKLGGCALAAEAAASSAAAP